LEVVERKGPPTAASIVSPPDYASENGGSGIVELSLMLPVPNDAAIVVRALFLRPKPKGLLEPLG
jgi:hypothetical protein